MSLQKSAEPPVPRRPRLQFLLALMGGLFLGAAAGTAYVVHDLWTHLPDVQALSNYRPPLPLRIYAKDGELLAEYGEERRELVPMAQIPEKLRQALLSIEDANFYEHSGVHLAGIARAAIANVVSGERAQGASTITMQVARNFFLSRTKTYGRKLSEVLLACKLEQSFSKDKILELYMNQVYLGERAYGFAAAASVYFGKSLQDLTLAEAAMLAGLPKAPSIYNPVANLERATVRQQYILQRMRALGYISEDDYRLAAAQSVHAKPQASTVNPDAAYATELARRMVVDRFGQDAYSMGLDVVTTIGLKEQMAATQALRAGLVRTQNGLGYAGPEAQVGPEVDLRDPQVVAAALQPFASAGPMRAAVVRTASLRDGIDAALADGSAVHVAVAQMPAGARKALAADAPAGLRVQRGAIVWVEKSAAAHDWRLTQRPQMEGALVSLDSESGDIVALAGGFDFSRSNFDHATQAERQAGSTFKPFVFSAALEKGLFPGTGINDEQRVVVPAAHGQPAWEPKNSPARYDGFITEREGLAKSKNVIAVNVMEAAGERHVHDHAAHFGFDMSQGHEGLTLALGAKSVTPLELARAYSVFANGGNLVYPKIIRSVSERGAQTLFDQAADDLAPVRVTSQRNAYVMNSLLQSVVRSGSGHRAAQLGRSDVAGKTGTSNDAKDAWFSGYSSGLTTVAWIGFDQPKSLGKVSGGSVALPVWLDYMQKAVEGRAAQVPAMPPDLAKFAGDFVYPEYLEGRCIVPPDYVDTPFRCGTEVAAWRLGEARADDDKPTGLSEQRAQISQLFTP